MKIKVIIEKNKTGLFSAYVENDLPGFDLNGQGYTVEDAKNEMLVVYEEMKELLVEEDKDIPVLEFEYKYDIPSLFNEFDMINISKFAKSIGLNPSLIRRYACGEIYASEKQCLRIKEGLDALGKRLQSASV